MFLPSKFRFAFLISALFLATAAFAQTQEEEVGALPETISIEQLQLLEQLRQGPVPEATQRVRRRLPRAVVELTPEQISYREAVRKLGVNEHQFVHCELISGKVRTGTIAFISEDQFALRDDTGFTFHDHNIAYSDLKAAPRRVKAVGTRIIHGFEWTGVALVTVVFLPIELLMALGMALDGCC